MFLTLAARVDVPTRQLLSPMKLDVFELRYLEIRIILGSLTNYLVADRAPDSPRDVAVSAYLARDIDL